MLILSGADPGLAVLFGDADARVAMQDGDLIDGDFGQQRFNGEGVAEDAAECALRRVGRLMQVGYCTPMPVGA